MLRSIKTNQRLQRQLNIRLDGTGTAALTIGSGLGTLVDNGTGDYTITFNRAFSRTPMGHVTPITAAKNARLVLSTTTCQVLGFNQADGTTASDLDCDLTITGWDTTDEYSENS